MGATTSPTLQALRGPQASPPTAASSYANPFDLDDALAYGRWRDAKLKHAPRGAEDLVVEVRDPTRLSRSERDALLERLQRSNMAVYAGPAADGADSGGASVTMAVAAQLGMQGLDANAMAGEDGVSRIEVCDRRDERGGFIPYTDRAIRWHTDGYYQPDERRIRGMLLHCVRPAAEGGVNTLLDHEIAYLALRDLDPAHVAALMAPDAMTIPARDDEAGMARAPQQGPVFSVDDQGALHMRYTARTRSIQWKTDDATQAALAALERYLGQTPAHALTLRLQAGMGLVSHNVLHERSAFVDDPARPRLLYRARYRSRAQATDRPPWRTG